MERGDEREQVGEGRVVVPVGVGEEGEEVGGEIRWGRVQGGEGSDEV